MFMGKPYCREALLRFSLCLLFAAGLCHGSDMTLEVIGSGECADCNQKNINSTIAFSGLHVTIDCKPEDGNFKTRGKGELDEEGNFKVKLSDDILTNGELKEKCYAQLHSAAATPCPAHHGLQASQIVFKSKADGKLTYGIAAGGLKFTSVTCASAFFWHYFHHPPLPPLSFPKFPHPPLLNHPFPPIYKKPCPPTSLPPPVPVIEKPLPPPVPVYKPHPPPVYKPKPPVPVYKPHPPPVYKPKPPVYKPKPPVYKPKPPVYKPKPPVYKPKPPVYKPPTPVPVYKKPLPPPTPTYKHPIFKHPIFKHPIFKHLPPIPKIPPLYKKPCPPIPKIPPKYFSHPKFGKWPPLSPHLPHP